MVALMVVVKERMMGIDMAVSTVGKLGFVEAVEMAEMMVVHLGHLWGVERVVK